LVSEGDHPTLESVEGKTGQVEGVEIKTTETETPLSLSSTRTPIS